MQQLVAPRLMVMMFLQFFIWGAWYVTAAKFLGSKAGFEGSDIGWTYAVGPIAGMISPFFVGMIADRYFSSERILGVLHLLGAAIMGFAAYTMGDAIAASQGEGAKAITELLSAATINGYFLGYMLTYYPTLSLTNSLALHNMTNAEKEFPIIRVFGTIGWIVAGLTLSLFGWDDAKDPSINMFYLSAGASLLLGIYSFTLPNTPPAMKGQDVSFRQIAGLDALSLLKKPSYLVFMVCSIAICIPLAFYYQAAERYVSAVAEANKIGKPALIMTTGQMSEIFFMVAMPFFFVRLGVKWMLAVGMGCWVARYGLFALGAEQEVFWMALIGVLLHGICYDFFFVTGQIYTDKVAPKEIRAQAQGMLVFFTLGLGMFVGAKIGGYVEEMFTTTVMENAESKNVLEWKMFWGVPCMMAGVVMALFIVLFKVDPEIDEQARAEQASDTETKDDLPAEES